MIGFIHHGDIEATGEFQRAGIQMSNIQPAGHEVMRGKILLESDTVLPDTDKLISSYPSTLVRQTDSDYQNQLLPVILGKNYRTTEDTELTTQYASSDPLLPYRYARVDKTNGRIWFYDSMVTGERDGEYAAPQMNTTFEESLQIAQKQASKMLSYECVAIPSQSWLEYLRIEYESFLLRFGNYVQQPLLDSDKSMQSFRSSDSAFMHCAVLMCFGFTNKYK